MQFTDQQHSRGKKLSTSTGRRGRGRATVEPKSTSTKGRRGERGGRRARGRPPIPVPKKLQNTIEAKKKEIEEAEQQLKAYTEGSYEVEGGEYEEEYDYEEVEPPVQTIKQTKSKRKRNVLEYSSEEEEQPNKYYLTENEWWMAEKEESGVAHLILLALKKGIFY
jgi:hypothetical protein